jgi:hypothetical protein
LEVVIIATLKKFTYYVLKETCLASPLHDTVN